MLTGVCKLTVDAIMLACRSFINFGNGNVSLHACNLLVIAWHRRDTLFFCNSFQNNNILKCSRVQTKSYCTNNKFLAGICIYKRAGVKVKVICNEVWTSVWTKLRKHLVSYMYKCLHVTFCSWLSKENIGMSTFHRWGRLHSAHHFVILLGQCQQLRIPILP